MKKLTAVLYLALACSALLEAASPTRALTSPDGTIKINVTTGQEIRYSVSIDGKEVLSPSAVSITLTDGNVYGGRAALRKTVRSAVRRDVKAQAYRKSLVKDCFNQMELVFRDFSLTFRAYDNGVAYRFTSLSGKDFKVQDEQVEYAFPGNRRAFIPYVCQNDDGAFEKQMHNSFENSYRHQDISEWDLKHLAFLPLMVECEDGIKLCISESDLMDYPGMFLYNAARDNSLEGRFPKYPILKTKGDGDGRTLYVQSTEDFIAKCKAGASLPWRLIGISREDKDMADNDLVYLLASEPEPAADFSWVKPGKVAWDWWNDLNIYGVDFKSGINNETYKYYIDFASRSGIEYIIMDEGWSVGFEDLFHIAPQIDLPELIEYGRQRNVGIILWAGYGPFAKDIEKACRVYSEMGVKGFKVDFMDACDQPVVEFHRQAAEIASRYHMLIDFHGTYKPTGLSRTYPNVLNYEGIYGLENLKWNQNADQVTYDVTIPYIRFFAGAADYTQGAMRNATKANFKAIWNEAMSQGTRCHQLAEYVVFFSPLNMLCDSPSNYMAEAECLECIADVPEVWDETVALDGKVGEYIVIARRSGDKWYVGALGDWNARELDIALDFLGDGEWNITEYRDGINADKAARDYKKSVSKLAEKSVSIRLASGGGYLGIISPASEQ